MPCLELILKKKKLARDSRSLRKGVKEVTKAIRKGKKGFVKIVKKQKAWRGKSKNNHPNQYQKQASLLLLVIARLLMS